MRMKPNSATDLNMHFKLLFSLLVFSWFEWTHYYGKHGNDIIDLRKSIVRTCEILLAYVSNERENKTLPVFVDITYLHFFRCIQLYWNAGVGFLGQNGEQTKTDSIGLFPGNFQLNYGRITFQKLVQPILPTDFHFTNGTSFAIQ